MEFSPNAVVSLTTISPVLSQQQFAVFIGTTIDTVRGWVETDAVPTVRISRQRYINVIAFVNDLKNGKTVFTRGDYGNE